MHQKTPRKAAMMFKEGNVTVMVRDMKRSVVFYTEVLGLKKGREFGEEWVDIEGPNVRIGLHPTKKKSLPAEPSGNVSIGFLVDDLDEAMATLGRRGVKFGDVVPDKGARFAFFSDPDGAPLYLIEMKW
jgi:catechol 2,3-dioxygenase-like lactoylglutathione lyase family enzyme